MRLSSCVRCLHCRRSINFLRTCISHSSKVVRCVANYGIFHGRCVSPAGRNALHCMNRYSATLSDVLSPVWEPALSGSMPQRHFYSAGTIGWSINQSKVICNARSVVHRARIWGSIYCASALWFVTMFLLLPDFYTVADVQFIILYICSL